MRMEARSSRESGTYHEIDHERYHESDDESDHEIVHESLKS